MVTLEQMRASNAQIATTLPGLIAVFAGATSGIGESSLKQFAKHAVKPRIYFLGRSKESGNRIQAELQKLNPEGEYIFISADLSLLRSVDNVCREIKEKETAINLLFLSTGSMITGKETPEDLHYPFAIAYYARLRIILNLLPLLRRAPTGTLRRVVTVFAGTKEGPIDTTDLQARRLQVLTPRGRGHFSAMMTLALERIAREEGGGKGAGVSFVHDFPGFVKTNFGNDVPGVGYAVLRGVFNLIYPVIGPLFATPVEEAGERHVFFATSGRFPGSGVADGVPLSKGVGVARGTDGGSGSGVYSIDDGGESASPKVEELLRKLREDGTAEKVWADMEAEFVRITGVKSV